MVNGGRSRRCPAELAQHREHGITEVVDAMLESDLVLNRKGMEASMISHFLSQFPTKQDERVMIEELHESVMAFRVRSHHDPVKILATDTCADFLGGNYAGRPVVRIPEPPSAYAPAP
jgi:hypothetical protein